MKLSLPTLPQKLQIAAMLAATMLFAFVGFHLLYSARVSEYSKEFIAGCIGALITIIATAVLLRSQTRSEIIKGQIAATFERKLDTYNSFLEHLNKINEDGKITEKKFNSTIDWGVKLALFCRPYVIKAIHDYLFQLAAYGVSEFEDLEATDLENWIAWQTAELGEPVSKADEDLDINFTSYGYLVHRLREDLLELDNNGDDDHFDVMEIINKIRSLRGATLVRFDPETGGIEYEY